MQSGKLDSTLEREHKKYIINKLICLVDFETLIFKNNGCHSIATNSPTGNFNNFLTFENLVKTTSTLNPIFLVFYKNPKCRTQASNFLKALGNPQNVKTHIKEDEELVFAISSLKIKFQESYNAHDGIMYFQLSQPHITKTISPRVDKFEYLDVQADNLSFIKMKFAEALSPVKVHKNILETIFLPSTTNLTPKNSDNIHTLRDLFSRFNYARNWLDANNASLGITKSFIQYHFQCNFAKFQDFYGSNFLYSAGIATNNKGNLSTIPEDVLHIIFNYVSLSQLVYRQ